MQVISPGQWRSRAIIKPRVRKDLSPRVYFYIMLFMAIVIAGYLGWVYAQFLEIKATSKYITTTYEPRLSLPAIKAAYAAKASQFSGVASYYDYSYRGVAVTKLKRVCAVRDWPRGTKIKATSPQYPGRSTICTVTDYGPDKSIHPDRIIDFGSLSFRDIAGSLKPGTMTVHLKVE